MATHTLYPQLWWQHQALYSAQEFREAMKSTFVQPLLRALFSQFRHSSTSSIRETTTNGVGKIRINKSSGPIEFLLQPKSRKKKRKKKRIQKKRKKSAR